MVSIDGTDISSATIDGTDVSEITVDGDTVWTAIPDSGVTRYEFEDDSDTTTAVDSWGNQPMSLNGPSYTATSKYGDSALDFDGVDDTGTSPHDDSLYDSAFSVSLWVYPNGTYNNYTVVNYDDNDNRNWGIGWANITSDSAYELWINDSSVIVADGSYPTSGEYVNFIITYDGSLSTFYINSDEIGTHSETINTTGNGTLFANVNGGNRGDYGDYILDDVQYHNKELSSSEVSNIYTTGSIDG